MKDNLISLPNVEVGDISNNLLVDFSDVDSSAIDKVFDIMELLNNKNELIKKFTPLVNNFIQKETLFNNSIYKKAYDDAFYDFILSLIKNEIIDHFNFTPEEFIILTERDFINLITEGYYFNKQLYKGDNNV